MTLRRVLAAPVLVLSLVLVAACGGGSSTSSPSPTPTGPPSPRPATAAELAEINTAWSGFFNPAGTIAAHAALLENGDAFVAELTTQSKDPAAKDLSSTVTSAVVTGDSADVIYDLLGKGGVKLLPAAQGKATRVDGTWKVSKFTFCQLIGLQDPKTPHPGCV